MSLCTLGSYPKIMKGYKTVPPLSQSSLENGIPNQLRTCNHFHCSQSLQNRNTTSFEHLDFRPPGYSSMEYVKYQVPEIWHKIAMHCEPRDTLKQLSLVSPFFRAIAQSHLFRNLEHRSKHDEDDDDDTMPVDSDNPDDFIRPYLNKQMAAERRFNMLASSPLVHLVRSWQYQGDVLRPRKLHDDGFDEVAMSVAELMASSDKDLLAKFTATLPRYPQLQSLKMQGLVLDDSLLHVLTQLVGLEWLELSRVTIGTLSYPYQLRVRKLLLDTSNHPNLLVNQSVAFNCHPRYLQSLTLKGLHIVAPFLSSLNRERYWSNLESLTIELNLAMVPNFFTLLEGCPALTNLDVDRIQTDPMTEPYPQYQVSSNACPNLSIISGPAYFVSVLVADRPVQEISIMEFGMLHDVQDFRAALYSGSRSTVTVKKLHIYGGDAELYDVLLQHVQTYFPRLERLSVMIDDSDDDEMDIEDDEDEEMDIISVGSRQRGVLTVSDHFADGYPKLIARISLGLIQLPTTLAYLEIVQTYTNRLDGSQRHAIMREISRNARFNRLQTIVIGSEEDPYHFDRALGNRWVTI